VLVLVLVAVAAPTPQAFRVHGQGPLALFLAVLLAAFSFAAYTELLRARAVLLVGLGVGAAALLDGVFNQFDPGFWAASALFAIMGWLYRRRRLRVSQLEGETQRLRHDRDNAARAAIAEERARIARELHDVVAHSVSLMTVQAGAARHTLDPLDTEMHEALESIETAGRQALVELRRLLGVLRRSDEEPLLAPVPGLGRLDALVEQMRDAGLPATVRINGTPAPLPPGVDLAAYRIVQEALTNALKHGRPQTADVIVTYRRHELELTVLDDGRSANPGSNGCGHGLIGMQERVSLYGGALEAGPRDEGGFAVHARLPLDWSDR
jgi:signal transduction histidine kinase